MIRPARFCRMARRFAQNALCFLALVAGGLCYSGQALGTEPVISGRTTVKVSDIGVSDVQISLKTQVKHYTALKQMGGNFTLLARQIGMDDRNWASLDDLTGEFNDTVNEVKMKFCTPGYARNVKANHWVIRMNSGTGCQLVSSSGSHVTLMCAETTDIGLGTMVIDVELPAGSTNATFDSQKCEITYDFTPSVTSGTHAELEFEVDHKTTLMSSLAKNYSNPNFNYLWAARATAKNTGDQILNNYRVRFRVAEMGSWSSWQRAAKLYPGQTVVDPFFPIFDLEKVMSLNGSRPAVIEVEYEYEEVDGTKVQESDSYPVQILSRNEVIFSSLKPEQITGFVDQFDFAPALMTSMTTPADPVVQQLAGRINGMAAESYGQSIAASQSDDQCIAFMSAMHHFMTSNRVAYQSPPGLLTQGNHGQHIKYPRDVLRNRAGTCVDLAVTWASVCEAVGLEPAIILISGHAFPAVKLPQSKQWLAIESTMLNSSFKDAVEKGNAELSQALEGEHYLIDITEVRRLGVLSLDLPSVTEEYLTNLGYKFEAQRFEQPAPQNEAVQQEEATANENQNEGMQDQGQNQGQDDGESIDATSPAPDSEPTVTLTSIDNVGGHWGGFNLVTEKKTWVEFCLNGDSSFEAVLRTHEDDGTTSEQAFAGNWAMRKSDLVLRGENGNEVVFHVEVVGDNLKVWDDSDPGYLVLKKMG